MVLPFLIALVVTAVLVPVSVVVAGRWGIVATPRADRWNARRVPRLGGLAITAGILAGAAFGQLSERTLIAVLVGTLAMAALGLADDLRNVRPITRLLVQAILGVVTGLVLTWHGGVTPPVLLVVALSVFTIPLLTNATNLVDNADGLAATLSAASGLALAAIGAVGGLSDASTLGLILAGGALGFALHNHPPARVFMGDVGSLPLGFGVAAASLVVVSTLGAGGSERWSLLIALPAAWAMQLGDLAMVFVTRLRRGVSPFRGGVDHTSHRLMRMGLGPRSTLALLASLALAAGLIGVAAAASGELAFAGALIIGLGLAITAFEALLVHRVPFSEGSSQGQHPQRPLPRAAHRSTGESEQA